MRKLILKVHLYLTLVCGTFVLIVTVTGAALVFDQEIDHALNRATSSVVPGPRALPLDALVARVAAAFPDRPPEDVVIPERSDRPLQVRLAGSGAVAALVDPYTGTILGSRDFAKADLGRGLARTLYAVHTRLMAGRVGEYLVGAVTITTLVTIVTGLYLWWRLKIVHVRWKSPGKRFNFDLHNVFGVYAAVFLVFVTLTGTIISFEAYADPLIKRWFNRGPDPQPPKASSPSNGRRISLDEAVRLAQEALPGARPTIVSVPSTASAVIRVTVRFPEDRSGLGRSRVYLDQYTGAVLHAKNTRTDSVGTRILNVKRSVHTGEVFGWPTRILAFLSCLFLLGQLITGVLIWSNRRFPGRGAKSTLPEELHSRRARGQL
jgi:uncharacterized iron-regulated membrane protein